MPVNEGIVGADRALVRVLFEARVSPLAGCCGDINDVELEGDRMCATSNVIVIRRARIFKEIQPDRV